MIEKESITQNWYKADNKLISCGLHQL